MKNKLKFSAQAILFDMDGVIIDSMPYHFLAWYESLRPFGIRVSCLDVYQKEGERWEKTLQNFLRRAGIRPAKKILKKIFQRRQNIFRKNFKRFIFMGTFEFLRCLKQRGYLLALVSGTPLSEIKSILPAKIHRLFDLTVAGDQIKQGKPSPEPYLTAARIFGINPQDCLVVENSPFGIASAKRAGMFCIALTTSLPKVYLQKADIVVDRLEQIIPFIEHACHL